MRVLRDIAERLVDSLIDSFDSGDDSLTSTDSLPPLSPVMPRSGQGHISVPLECCAMALGRGFLKKARGD